VKLIDIGAFNGDSALHFISYPDIDSIDAYEPNRGYGDIWDAISRHYPEIRFIPKVVYTHNGNVEYTMRPVSLPLGSTIMKSKEGWGDGEIIEVPCVDILDIIPDEPFCLKLDAEGAEYDILERLIESGKHTLVDRLYVEWHDSKMTSDNFARQVAIVNYFGKRIKAWL
jgi:FkbM family methyltransferase